jgi:hypothetical protein
MVAVVMLAPIIQAPSRKHIVKNDIWHYSAAGRFVRNSQAPNCNSMWIFNIRLIVNLCRLCRRPSVI